MQNNVSVLKVEVFRDGNAIMALWGPDSIEGCMGTGDNVADALEDLARGLRRDGLKFDI